MYQTDHDKIAERKRDEALNALIDHYMEIAVSGSDEYGFLNVSGHEVPDPTIMEPPLGFVPAPDLMAQMRSMVQNELSRIAEAQELETFEEADDFDIEDDPVDYSSPYELYFDPAPGEPPGPPGESGGAGGVPPPAVAPSPPSGAGSGSPSPDPAPGSES